MKATYFSLLLSSVILFVACNSADGEERQVQVYQAATTQQGGQEKPWYFEDEDEEDKALLPEDDGSKVQKEYKAALELLETGDVAGALKVLEKSAAADPSNPLLAWNVASVYMAGGDYPSALGWIEKAVLAEPGNPEFLVAKAQVLSSLGRVLEAKAILTELLGNPEARPQALFPLGQILFDEGKTGEAQGLFEEAVKINKEELAAWMYLGILAVQREDWALAEDYLRRSRTGAEPELMEQSEMIYGQVLAKLGRCEESAKLMKDAAKMGQEDAATLFLAECWKKSGDAPRALGMIAPLAKSRGDCAPCNLLHGDLLFDLEKWVEAQGAYERAAKADDTLGAAHRQWGKCLLNRKEYKAAFPHLEKATKLEPQNPDTWLLLGQGALLAGKKARVWDVLKQLNTLDPDKASQLRKTLNMME